MLANDIYNVYKLINGKRHQAGRFLVHDGHVRHLEDYYNEVDVPEGAVDDYTLAKLTHPKPGNAIASEGDMRSGKHLDLIPEADLVKPIPQPTDVTPEMIQQHLLKLPPPVWNYRRSGHDMAHTLEHHGEDKFSLDGNPLSRDELKTISLNLKNKSATLRYKADGVADTIAKMEHAFDELRKEDIDPEQALKHVEDATKAGHVPEESFQALRRQIYTDPMTGGIMGNKYAFGQFRQKNKPGVYVSMDGNDFKSINDLYGHEAGDQAVQAFGQAAREAMDEAVGNDKGKLFRNPDEQNLYRSGGDEFVAHVPTHEHAAKFARALRAKLEQVPPIAGQHKLSMSFGFGNDFNSADTALNLAKEQKYHPAPLGAPRVRKFLHGQVPSLAHSLVPGFEGAVPLQENQLPKIDMPEGAKVEPPKPEEGQLLHTPKLPELVMAKPS
jgi:GGDEF domain-containing protein